MVKILPIAITRPLRNKVCVFPEKETCNLSPSDINGIIRRNPFSFYNIMYKPYVKRLQGEKKFNAIKRQFHKFKRKRIIEEDENPGFYIYNIIDGNNEFTGILGKIHFNEVVDKKIKHIEYGFPTDVEALREQFEITGFLSTPFNIVYEENNEIQAIINKYKTHIPLFEFTKSNGKIHEVWKVLDKDDILKLENSFGKVDSMYLLDNRNEFEAYYDLYRKKNQEKNPLVSGNEAFNFFPAFMISHKQVKIFEYKKGIQPDSKIKVKDLLTSIKKDFYIQEIDKAENPNKGEIMFFTQLKKYKLQFKHKFDNFLPDAVIFGQYILPKLQELDEGICVGGLKYCSGDRSAKCVENQLNKGNCKLGFVLSPASFEQIKYADKNKHKLPVFSVYLEPRLLKGLFIYEF